MKIDVVGIKNLRINFSCAICANIRHKTELSVEQQEKAQSEMKQAGEVGFVCIKPNGPVFPAHADINITLGMYVCDCFSNKYAPKKAQEVVSNEISCAYCYHLRDVESLSEAEAETLGGKTEKVCFENEDPVEYSYEDIPAETEYVRCCSKFTRQDC